MSPTPMATAVMRMAAATDAHVPAWVLAAALVLAIVGLLLNWRRERLARETIETPPPAQRYSSERGVRDR